MTEPNPAFFRRLALAWRTLLDTGFAADVARLEEGETPSTEAPEPAPTHLKETPPDAALQLLGLLQQEGRLVDFLQEDVSGFSDTEIGAAARVVHEGCRRALHQHLTLDPVRDEQEGVRITLQKGFDASAVRLTGNVVGQPPFNGTLAHRGWRATGVKLPKIAEGHDASVLAPAEVEL
jgi:hypothetical protein